MKNKLFTFLTLTTLFIAQSSHAEPGLFLGGWLLDQTVENSPTCETGLYISQADDHQSFVIRYNQIGFSVDMTWTPGKTFDWGNHEFSRVNLSENDLIITLFQKKPLSSEKIESITAFNLYPASEQNKKSLRKVSFRYEVDGELPARESCSFISI